MFFIFVSMLFVGAVSAFEVVKELPPAEVKDTSCSPSWHQIIPTADRFVLVMYNNAAVLDRETCLVWERMPGWFEMNGKEGPYLLLKQSSWEEATYSCESKNTGGRKGWHLPTVEQLMTLADPTLFHQDIIPPLPTGHPFILDKIYGDIPRAYFWTLTTSQFGPDYAKTGYFGDYITPGNGQKGNGGDTAHHWCVRGGQSHDYVSNPN